MRRTPMTIRVTHVVVMIRGRARRYHPSWQGAILQGVAIVWRCGHVHDVRREAQHCAEHEALQRGIPVAGFDSQECEAG